jgi:hypothetical protein
MNLDRIEVRAPLAHWREILEHVTVIGDVV